MSEIDGSNWRRILLHWANRSECLESLVYDLDQTDIESFYINFRDRITATIIREDDTIAFLKCHYPNFEPHLGDDNLLSAADYMYVYSLFLHFSCVKYLDSYFQKVCQGLPEQFQQAIASFLQVIIAQDVLNKENLRHAIASASPKSLVPFLQLESPIRTPRSNKYSPPTPGTNLIAELSKEIKLLKAYLDAERYERGCAELQLKQNEEALERLALDQKRHLSEISQLKNELLTKSTENYSPSKSVKDEQIIKRLRKEVTERDEEIINLKETVVTLQEENKFAVQKRTYTEKQISSYLEKINELDTTVNSLRAEIEEKESSVKKLSETVNELEIFINETRSSPGGRLDLNMSAECFDLSISRNTNSSGSFSSPENLGCAVIDIQLQEKELENIALQKELEKIKFDNAKLSNHITELITKHFNTLNICGENLLNMENDDITQTFLMFENFLGQLVDDYKNSREMVEKIGKEINDYRIKETISLNRLAELEYALQTSNKKIDELNREGCSLRHMIEEFKELQDKDKEKIQEIVNQNTILSVTVGNLQKLKEELVIEKNELMESNSAMTLKLTKVTNDLNATLNKMSEVENTRMNLEQVVKDLQNTVDDYTTKVSELQQLNTTLENDKNALTNIKCDMENKLVSLEDFNKKILEEQKRQDTNYTCLINERDQEVSILTNTLSNLEKECEAKAKNLLQIQSDFEIVQKRNGDLENEIEILKNKCNSLESAVSNFQETIKNLEDSTTEKGFINDQLTNEFTKYKESNEKIIKELINEKDIMNSLVNEQSESNKNLELELKTSEARILNLIQEIDNNKYVNDHLQNLITQKEIEIGEISKCVKTLQAENCEIELFKNKIYEKNEDLENTLIELKEINKELQTQNTILICNTKQYEETIEDLDKQYSSLKISFDEIKSELEYTTKSRDDLKEGFNEFEKYSNATIQSLKDILNEAVNENIKQKNDKLHAEEKLQEFKNKLNDAQRIEKDLLTCNDNLKENVEKLRQKWECSEKQRQDMHENIEQLNKQFKISKSDLNNLQIKNDLLETSILSLTEHRDNLCSENKLLESKIKMLKAEREEMVKNVERLQNTQDVYKKNIEKLQNSFEQSESKIRQLKDKKKLLETDNLEKKNHLELLEEKDRDNSRRIEELTFERCELQNMLKSAAESVSGKENQLKTLLNENSLLKESLELARQEASDFKICVKNLSEEMNKIQALYENSSAKEMELNLEMTDIKEKFEALTNENINLQNQSDILQKELNTIVTEKDVVSKNYSDLVEIHNSCENIKSNLEFTITELSSYRKEKENEIIQQKELYKELEEKYIEIQTRLAFFVTDNEKLLSDNNKLEAAKENLTKILEINRDKEIQLNQEIGKLKCLVKEICDSLENENFDLRNQRDNLHKELSTIVKEKDDLSNKYSDLIETHNSSINQLKYCRKEKENEIIKYQDLDEKYKEIQKKLTSLTAEKQKLLSANDELETAKGNLTKRLEKNEIKEIGLNFEIEKLKSSLKEKCDTMANEIVSITDEKNILHKELSTIITERDDLSKKYNDLIKTHNDCQKLKSDLESNINELRSCRKEKENKILLLEEKYNEIQNRLASLAAEKEQLLNANNKLLAAKENLTKRLEKNSIKLGENQGALIKSEKLNADLKNELLNTEKNYNKIKASLENLQRDHMKLQEEFKIFKEKYNNLNATQKDVSSDVQNLQKDKSKLENRIVEIQQSENNLKITLKALENEKKQLQQSYEKALSKVTDTLLEINAAFVNKMIKTNASVSNSKDNHPDPESNKKILSSISDYNNKCEDAINCLHEMKSEYFQMRTTKNQLLLNIDELKEQNSKLLDKFSKASVKLEMLQSENDNLIIDIAKLRSSIDSQDAEINTIKKDNFELTDKLKEEESQNEKFVNKTIVKNESLNSTIEIKSSKIDIAEEDNNLVGKNQELDKYKADLEETMNHYANEKQKREICERNISILQAKLIKSRQTTDEKEKKWLEEKMKFLSEIECREKRIKETRFEMEGKLEKMKAKMKDLHKDEVSKIKTKFDALKAEFTIKEEKYEEHIQVLSKQIFQLNEAILELQKENKFMEARLKEHTKSFAHICDFPPMNENESDELMSTFLTDFRPGRLSFHGRESVSANELHYRNSLAPPHLRSTYTAQYGDQHLREDDIKDNILNNLDDSLTSLLHTGQRKKISGTTSYKKPGPPTPSKNGGRLSLGGNEQHHREILKETNDTSSLKNEKRTSPGKLKTFFSTSKSKDEHVNLYTLEYNVDQTKKSKTVSKPKPMYMQFTSTPRTSKVHLIKKRSLLPESNKENIENIKKGEFNFPSDQNDPNVHVKECCSDEKDKFKQWREPNVIYTTDSCTTSDSNCPHKTSCSRNFNIKVNKKRTKERRISLFYRNQICMKSKLPSKVLREQHKNKSKQQRSVNFNKFRKSMGLKTIILRKSQLSQPNTTKFQVTSDGDDNPYEINEHLYEYIKTRENGDDDNNSGLQEFEMLLTKKESTAPFTVTNLDLVCRTPTNQSTTLTSKTLYAGNAIVNRKIPRLSTTLIKEGAFNGFLSNGKQVRCDLILVEERQDEITLGELLSHWHRMNKIIKIFFGICIFLLFLNAYSIFLTYFI